LIIIPKNETIEFNLLILFGLILISKMEAQSPNQKALTKLEEFNKR